MEAFRDPGRASIAKPILNRHASDHSEPAYCFLKVLMKPHTLNARSSSDALAPAAAGPTGLISLIALLLVLAGCSRASGPGAASNSSGGEMKRPPASKRIDPLSL